jgi:hypothetical protein
MPTLAPVYKNNTKNPFTSRSSTPTSIQKTLDTSSTSTSYISIDVQYFIMSILGFYVLVLSVIVLRCVFFYITDIEDIETKIKTKNEENKSFYIDVDLNDFQRKTSPGFLSKPRFSTKTRITPLMPLQIIPSRSPLRDPSFIRTTPPQVEQKAPLFSQIKDSEEKETNPRRVYTHPKIYPPLLHKKKEEIPYNPNFLRTIDLSGIDLSWLDDDDFTNKNGVHPHKPSLVSKLFSSVSSKSFSSYNSDSNQHRFYSDKTGRMSSIMERFQYFTNPQTHTLLSLPKRSSTFIRPLYEGVQEFTPSLKPSLKPPPPPIKISK